MTQLSVPHFDDPHPAPAWLRPAGYQPREVVVVVLGAGQANPFGRLTRLSAEHTQSYRVRRRRTRFSWRSAWLGALSALGLAGGLAAAAGATQLDRPIRIELPPSRPAAALAPLSLIGRAVAPNTMAGRSNPLLRAKADRVLPAGTSAAPPAKLTATPPQSSSQSNGGGSGEFYRAEPVQAAAQRAILSGVAQSWTYGGLTGVVIAGPLDLRSNRACHRIALWAENRPESGDSMAFTSCLNDRGAWKTPAGLPPEPSGESDNLLELR